MELRSLKIMSHKSLTQILSFFITICQSKSILFLKEKKSFVKLNLLDFFLSTEITLSFLSIFQKCLN